MPVLPACPRRDRFSGSWTPEESLSLFADLGGRSSRASLSQLWPKPMELSFSSVRLYAMSVVEGAILIIHKSQFINKASSNSVLNFMFSVCKHIYVIQGYSFLFSQNSDHLL